MKRSPPKLHSHVPPNTIPTCSQSPNKDASPQMINNCQNCYIQFEVTSLIIPLTSKNTSTIPQTKLLFEPSLILCFTKPRNSTTSSKPTNENNILYSFRPRPKILCFSNMTNLFTYFFLKKIIHFINFLKVNYFMLLNR